MIAGSLLNMENDLTRRLFFVFGAGISVNVFRT